MEHIAPVKGGVVANNLAYYEISAARNLRWRAEVAKAKPSISLSAKALDIQIEKDERFWVVTALMSLFHRPDRVQALAELLGRCLGDALPVDGLNTWEEALSGKLCLYFEAHLPSPTSYKTWLAEHLEERILTPTLLRKTQLAGKNAEGSTRADAVLVAPDTGFAVVFEAKVLSDVSTSVQHDVMRNQLSRYIDVLLDRHPNLDLETLAKRRPERTCLVLLTPEIFRDNPTSRLYGWLMQAYREQPSLLQEHLPHRKDVDWAAVSRRLGWLTWEDFNRTRRGSVPWLISATDGQPAGTDTHDSPVLRPKSTDLSCT